MELLVVCHVSAPLLCAQVSHVAALAKWIADLVRYIERSDMLKDKKEAAKVKRKALSYVIKDGQLYKIVGHG